jgi:hypothetical protein
MDETQEKSLSERIGSSIGNFVAKDISKTLKRAPKTLLTLACLIVSPLLFRACYRTIDTEIKPKKPILEKIERINGAFYDPTYSDYGRLRYIVDIDNNGSADCMGNPDNGYYDWIAPEFFDSHGVHSETRIMTKEIRDLATKAMKTDQELSYAVSRTAYEQENQK